METKNESIRKVICPVCGHVFPVRFYVSEGTLRYSVYCSECKKTNVVEVQEIKK